ncbi:peptide deformylase [Cryptosporangium aurantiacum]|uniref:Peptide deformylase n=1 Tax=Cryptosporangium aurantiacum TaxID=134849 RepID=A0A1M7TUU0_9ACTN|nr:peptide deformylase [Cryptosporangium aurantiacum]SHN74522.1 peptide deformylase [Cryptosporangium aurantiacum]
MPKELDIDEWAAAVGLPEGRPHRITVHGSPVLHRRCQDVTEFDDRLKQLVADMLESMDAAEGVGLAANQIGVDARVFVYDCPDETGFYHVGAIVNPVVVPPEPGVDLDKDDEGCLSLPLEFAPLARPARASVTGQDLEGRPIRVDGTGLLARCLQHETDHLDGLLYVDKLGPDEREAVLSANAERIAAGTMPPWSEGKPREA